jgi:hypothetical protein
MITLPGTWSLRLGLGDWFGLGVLLRLFVNFVIQKLKLVFLFQGNMVVEDFINNRPPYLSQPFLINNGTVHQPGSYFVVIEKLLVSVGNDLSWAFEVLFASFFVYNLSYPPLLDKWYHLMEDIAFGISKKSSPTISNFISQLANV